LYKEVPIIWMHWNLQIKLWVWSHCQKNCFFKWMIMWKIQESSIVSVSFLANYLWSFWRSSIRVSCMGTNMKILTECLDICWINWKNKIIMSWQIWWKCSCFQKIIHSFYNSFRKSLISNYGSMDIWTMAWMSLLITRRCMCFDFLWMR
jgi:hypothetical protein